ncbi:MAG: Ig-like domain-containing protein, partial [candidate division Zixibacteria bacterium]|nr:Ig-like domain-containing protein [candidate division Zixibacteria bacterium]
PDGDTPILSVSTLPGTASFVDNGDGTGTFDWTPSFADSGVYNITFYAADSAYPTAIDSEEVAITVTNVNQLPLLTAIGSQSVIEGGTLSFDVSAADPDGNTPVLTTSTLPGSATFVDNADGTGNFDWTTSFLDAGTHFVTFYAADSVYPSDVDSEIVAIVVGESGNQPPVWDTTLTDTMIQENDILTFNVSAVDPDSNNIILSVNTLLNNYSFVDNGNGSGVLTYSPSYEDAGIDTVRFIAIDDGSPSLSSILPIQITTIEVNQPPVFDSTGPFSVDIEDTLEFTVTASDPTDTTGANLFLSVLDLPTNATFVDNTDNTGTFTFAPVLGQEGIDTVTFLATDQGSPSQTGSMPIEITVLTINYPPELSEIGPQTVLEGDTLTIDMSATDPDSVVPTLEAINAPENSTFIDNGDGTAQFVFIPSYLQAGLFYVTFQASDSIDVDKEVVLIQVFEAGDQAPSFVYVPTITGIEGDTLSDSVTAVDPDLDPVVLTVDESATPDNFTFTDQGDGKGLIVFLPDFSQAGTYDIDVIATTDTLADTVTVTIDAQEFGNHTPVLDSILNQEIMELHNLQFTVTASDTDGVDPVLSASALPGASTFNPTTGIFGWIPTDTDSGSYDVWFYAVDGDPAFPNAIDSQIVNIHVLDTNRAPMFLVYPNQQDTVMEGDTLNRVITVWDDDGPIPSIEAYIDGTVDSLAPNMSCIDSGNGTGVFTFVPDFSQGDDDPTFYYIRFRVTDSVDESLSVVTSPQTIRAYDTHRPPYMVFSDGTGPFDLSENDTLSFDVMAVDLDGSGFPQIWVEGMPANCDTSTSINTLSFEFRPDFQQAGSYSVSFITQSIDPSALADTQVVDINVLDAGNQSPYFTTVLPDTILTFAGTQITTDLEAVDPDGDSLTFDASDTLTGASMINDGGGSARYVYDPDIGDVGTVTQVMFFTSDSIGLADTVMTYYSVETSKRGDADANSTYNINDIVYLINYLFRGGDEPYPIESGDADMDGGINVSDVVYLVNFLYNAGPRPPQ